MELLYEPWNPPFGAKVVVSTLSPECRCWSSRRKLMMGKAGYVRIRAALEDLTGENEVFFMAHSYGVEFTEPLIYEGVATVGGWFCAIELEPYGGHAPDSALECP